MLFTADQYRSFFEVPSKNTIPAFGTVIVEGNHTKPSFASLISLNSSGAVSIALATASLPSDIIVEVPKPQPKHIQEVTSSVILVS